MADCQLLSRIAFRGPPDDLSRAGLIAWCDADCGAVSLRGIELRRTWEGRLVISFPPARKILGRLSCYAKPVSDPARRAIQAEIIAAAMREGWLP